MSRLSKTILWLGAALLLIAGVSVTIIGYKQASGANALWKIVHTGCVPDMETKHNPAPCALVDIGQGETGGWTILKDRTGNTQYLLIPTAEITGIESPAILASNATNYFAKAWTEAGLVDQRVSRTLPRTDFALAINSESGRTQNQLHIHIDCVAPAVRAAVAKNITAIEDRWASFPEPLAGHAYRAMRISGDALTINPFKQLAATVVSPDGMGKQTLVVVGANLPGGTPGFVLLADAANLAAGDRGSGEELQDHSCALAKE
jgi:CDP-diacylglycerol pyrophosphatase